MVVWLVLNLEVAVTDGSTTADIFVLVLMVLMLLCYCCCCCL